jgi:hypothetical protein
MSPDHTELDIIMCIVAVTRRSPKATRIAAGRAATTHLHLALSFLICASAHRKPRFHPLL